LWNGVQQEGLRDDLIRGRSLVRTGEREKLPVAFRFTPKPFEIFGAHLRVISKKTRTGIYTKRLRSDSGSFSLHLL
jgi:hypothetical protein